MSTVRASIRDAAASDEAFSRVLAHEQDAATRSTARVRVLGSALLLVLLVCFLFTARPRLLELSLGVVAAHLVASVVFFFLAERRLALRLAWLAAVVDVAAIGAVQLVALQYGAEPQQLTGYGLGLFTLVLGINMQTMRAEVAWIAVVEAVALQAWTMQSIAASPLLTLSECVVLILVAVSHRQARRRLARLVAGLVQARESTAQERQKSEELASDKKLIEQMLAEAKARNEQLERLQREKETLAQVLVHDLRNPLAAVIGNVDWIHETLSAEGAHPLLADAAADALQRAHRLTAMISDILDVAKLEEGRLQPKRERLRAVHVCEEVRHQATQTARGRTLAVSVECDGAIELDADRELIRRVLENLVSNALRFTREKVHLAVRVDGEEAVLAVQNDGPPIEPESRGRLFEKFQQAHDSHAGWGLGLYFCRLAVEAHGGRIRLGEDARWNVSFEIVLPGARRAVALAA